MTTERAAAEAVAPNHAPAIGGSVRRAVPWSLLAAAVPRIVSFAITAVVARILSPHDFGVFAVALTVNTVVQSVGTLGVGVVVTRGDFDLDEIAGTVATISFVVAVVSAGLVAAFAHQLASLLGAPDAAGPLRVLALSLALCGWFVVPHNTLAREFRQKEIFIAVAAGNIPSMVLLTVLAAIGDGAMSFAWSVVFEHVVTGLLTYYYVRRFDWFPGFRLDVARRVLRYSLPVAGAALLTTLLLNVDYAVVGRQLGAYRLGLYLLAFNVASWPTALLGASIWAIVIPAFSRMTSDPQRRAHAVFSAVRTIGLVSFPTCALTCALSTPLLVTVYGEKWARSGPVLNTLAIYGALSILCLLIAQITISQGRTGRMLLLQLYWLALLIPAMVIGVHVRGIVGAGDAHVVVIVVFVLPAYIAGLTRAGLARVRDVVEALWPPLLGAATSGLAAAEAATAFHAAPLKLVVGGSVGVLIYLLVMAPAVAQLLGDWIPARSAAGQIVARYAAMADRLAGVPLMASAGRSSPAPAGRRQ